MAVSYDPNQQYQQQQAYLAHQQQQQYQAYLAQQREAAEGAALVSLSTKLLVVGLVLMMGGCGAGIGLQVPILIGIAMGIGFTVLIVGGVIGQIGRGKQGRIF